MVTDSNDDMHESWDEFEFQPDWTTNCGVRNNPHRLIMRKQCIHFFSAVLDLILFILAGSDNMHESLDGFEICLDLTTGFHGNI